MRESLKELTLTRFREFGMGLAVGLSLSLIVLVWQNYRDKNAGRVAAEVPRPEPRPDKDAAAGDVEDSAKNYDFYDMLPNFEVVVPEKDKDVKRDLPAAAKIERPGVYVLQAGSYRNESDAERVRAQLALQGISAKVQRVAVDTDVWHRVRIGPVNNLDELNKLRRQLQAAEVDALVIRIGD